MDSRDLLILGAVGAAAWFFFFRRQTQAQPAAAADPTNASAMAPGAAAQTIVGSPFVRGMATSQPFGVTIGGGPVSPFGRSSFQQTALLLTAKDNNPVPNPPPPPNAFFAPILGTKPVLGTAANTMGPEPTLRTNPTRLTGFSFG